MILQLSAGLRVLALLLTTADLSSARPHNSPRLEREALTTQDYVSYAVAGIDQLQTWYDATTGLWGNAWWNSANVITMLADFQEKFPSSVESITSRVFPTTLTKTPAFHGHTGFLNGFYDDELWWALAWIKVFDVTGETKYLDMA